MLIVLGIVSLVIAIVLFIFCAIVDDFVISLLAFIFGLFFGYCAINTIYETAVYSHIGRYAIPAELPNGVYTYRGEQTDQLKQKLIVIQDGNGDFRVMKVGEFPPPDTKAVRIQGSGYTPLK